MFSSRVWFFWFHLGTIGLMVYGLWQARISCKPSRVYLFFYQRTLWECVTRNMSFELNSEEWGLSSSLLKKSYSLLSRAVQEEEEMQWGREHFSLQPERPNGAFYSISRQRLSQAGHPKNMQVCCRLRNSKDGQWFPSNKTPFCRSAVRA